MPADPCLVTVKAGPSHSRGYENFVSNSLKDEILKEITSNLDESLKEEALNTFCDSVKDGFAIKDCIFKVQNDVLPKVPKERNKFFIKFTYDNQLQLEIGVNKFKNGNAQFYHKIGVAPKETTKSDVDNQQQKEMIKSKQRDAMRELKGSGAFPGRYLKKQRTNDRSAPCVSGKVSNPNGGWDDVTDYEVSLPPNPTNKQTVRALTGWMPDVVVKNRDAAQPKALGDLFRQKQCKPSQVKLRSRSVGRPLKEKNSDLGRTSWTKERSISPADVRHGRFKGALGDCFQTGIRPSQELLQPSESGSTKATPVIRRATWKRRENEGYDRASENNLSPNMIRMIKINQAKQESFEMDELKDEWDENCVKIEEMSVSGQNITSDTDKGYASCEEKEKIFLTETPTEPEQECIISYPDPVENCQRTRNIQCPKQSQISEYPIKNLIRHQNLPKNQNLFQRRTSVSPIKDKTSVQIQDGWYGPVLQRTRAAPNRCFGKLEMSPNLESCQHQNAQSQPNIIRKNSFNHKEGWIEIPIHRL